MGATEKLAVFLPAEGVPSIVNLLDPEFGSELDNLQHAVGGWVQAISLSQNWEGLVLWLNEEGKLINLPFNPIATAIWEDSFHGYQGNANDWVVGNALITAEADSNGETMGFDRAEAEFMVENLIALMELI